MKIKQQFEGVSVSVFKAWVTKTKDLRSTIRFWNSLFNLRILKLGFITRMNVFNWNLGLFDLGVISCWFIVGYVPYEICNRLVYSSLTEDVWIEGSCVLKIPDIRRKPVMFLAIFRPEHGWLLCFDCMNQFLVAWRSYLELVVGWGCRECILRPSPKFFRRPL